MRLLALARTIAEREIRGALRPLLLVVASLAIGVGTIAAVGVFAEALRETVRRDARMLLGGDLELENANRPVPADELARLLGPDARISTVVHTTALVATPEGRRLAVALKAVDEAWPLLGAVELDPPIPLAEALVRSGTVVAPDLLSRLGVRVGDRLRLGALELEIRGVVRREPDRLVGFAGLGPRLVVSRETAEAAEIVRPGALLRFEHRALVPEERLPEILERLRAREPEASWRLRTAAAVEPSFARFSDRLASYLTLAGLAALLLGGLGIALSVSAYLASRRPTIAVLKALGATSTEVEAAYGSLLGAAVAVAIALGLAAGQLAAALLASLAEGWVPLRAEVGLHLRPLVLAAAAGLFTAIFFAALPFARIREISAGNLLRGDSAATRRRRQPWPALAIGAAGLVGFSALAVDRWPLALAFFAGAGATTALLFGLGRSLLALAARSLATAPVAVRLAARGLARERSGALPAIVGLGTGLGALVTVVLLEANLSREIEARLAQRAPSHIVLDIQPDQWQRFERLLAETPEAELLQWAPVLRARITKIKGEPVDRATIAEHVRWTVDRDRGLTWRAEPPPGAELLAGRWWPPDYAGPPLVSIEGEVARGYGVEVGDKLAFNVLGRTIEAEIANIRREVDWTSGRLEFVFVLSPGVLERAPHVRIAALALTPRAADAFLDRLARELPNATPIEVGTIARTLEELLGKIGLAVRSVAGVLLVSGSMVLAASLFLARRRHLRDTVLFKLLGAPKGQILRVLACEQLLLAAIAALVGPVAGGLAAWGIARFVFAIEWQIAWPPLLFVSAAVFSLVFAIGALSVWRLSNRSVAEALRMP